MRWVEEEESVFSRSVASGEWRRPHFQEYVDSTIGLVDKGGVEGRGREEEEEKKRGRIRYGRRQREMCRGLGN